MLNLIASTVISFWPPCYRFFRREHCSGIASNKAISITDLTSRARRYLRKLEERIYKRKEIYKEKAKDYILALQTLIVHHPVLRQ